MTPVSTRLTPLLDDYLKETQSQLEFSEFDEDEEANRTRRRYLLEPNGIAPERVHELIELGWPREGCIQAL